ncbi:MAG TPA: serpin family protein, partial [Armatimonadota bacterium]
AGNPPDPRVISAGNALGWKLLPKFAATKPEGNVFFSPYSIAAAASMAYNGAGGQTKAEMARALGLGGLSLAEINTANARQLERLNYADPKVQVSVANSLWADDQFPLRKDFVERLRNGYAAEAATLDLQSSSAPGHINGWVSRNTGGKIENIVGPFGPLDALVLANAIYFHGEWSTVFKKENTRQQPFHLSDGTEKQVQMMFQGAKCRYLRGDDFQAVCLPYGFKTVSMYVFLPYTEQEAQFAADFSRERSKAAEVHASPGLTDWLQRLDAKRWDAWMQGFHPATGSLSLPRFRVEYTAPLKDALKAAGMHLAFREFQADFKDMTTVPDTIPYISQAQHRAFVDVDEEGTTAAAVTTMTFTKARDRAHSDFRMVVDHPFFCAIRDDVSGAVLFAGLIYDPVSR